MKLITAIFLTSISLTTFAASVPKYCGSNNECVLDTNFMSLKKGTAYALAEGRSCDEALELGAQKLSEEHGSKCSSNRVQPYGCYKTQRGTTKAWSRCFLDKKIELNLPRMKCAPGVILC